jgi:hypothetical protein
MPWCSKKRVSSAARTALKRSGATCPRGTGRRSIALLLPCALRCAFRDSMNAVVFGSRQRRRRIEGRGMKTTKEKRKRRRREKFLRR